VNLTSYAELAVRLVNTAVQAPDAADPLSIEEEFRRVVTDLPHLSGAMTPVDLDALRVLRDEFGKVFTAAATGRDRAAADQLNAMLTRCPIQPELVSHDGQGWHVHLSSSGSVADRYAAGAVIGLTLVVSQFGLSRLGTCSIASCQRVFIDASPNRSRRYCTEHGATRANVTTIRAQAHHQAGTEEGTGHAATAS
jgi:predicted RNA-binding Zn ribbon-like protein